MSRPWRCVGTFRPTGRSARRDDLWMGEADLILSKRDATHSLFLA